MYSVTKRIEFCYGHRLLDYDGICQHPHGHNALAEIEVGARRYILPYITVGSSSGKSRGFRGAMGGYPARPHKMERVSRRKMI